MINCLQAGNVNSIPYRPQSAGSGAVERTEETGPSESVQISKQRGFRGSVLARTAAALGLAATLFCAGAPAASAQQYYYPPQVYCGQVQTGQQSGITIDGRGNIGVYTTQQSVNTCTGQVQQNTVGVNRNGVVIQQQTGVPGWGVYQGPTVVIPNGGGHHHHHHHGNWGWGQRGW